MSGIRMYHLLGSIPSLLGTSPLWEQPVSHPLPGSASGINQLGYFIGSLRLEKPTKITWSKLQPIDQYLLIKRGAGAELFRRSWQGAKGTSAPSRPKGLGSSVPRVILGKPKPPRPSCC